MTSIQIIELQKNLILEINMVNRCILLGMLGLKLKTINKCLSSAPIKGRSQCYASCIGMSQPLRKWHVYIAGKSFYEDQSCVVEFLLRFENKQQNKPYNDSAQAQEIIIYW